MKKVKIFFSAIALFACVMASAQNITVKGVVTDASTGEPLPGAAILIKGTADGVVADFDGNYSITVAKNATLGFTTIGYKSTEVDVEGKTEINVALEPDVEMLSETIVVAYGTATKSSFTGSAAMVKTEEIEKKIATNVTSALAGTTPGVQVISSSGDPTSNSSSIRIRGIGSMSASSAPLIVVDGAPYDGSISDINPNDVESMSVLKDASASAIYGHRGANGVVIITTKKGKSGDATVKFDARLGVNSRLIPQYDVISDPGQYYETMYTQLYNNYFYSGHSAEESYAYADKYLFDEKNGGLGYQVFTVPEGEKLIGTNFKLNPNAKLGYTDGEYFYTPDDWYDEVFHNSLRQEYNVSVSGANDKFSYYASGSYLNDGGVVVNSGYQRFTGRINTEYQVKKWFKVISDLSYTYSDSKVANYSSTFGSSGNIFYITNNIGPIYPLYVRNADGTIKKENGRTIYDSNNTNFIRPNFVGNAVRDNEQDRNQTYGDNLNGKFGAIFTPVKGLSISANVSFMANNQRTNDLGSPYGGGAGSDGYAYVEHDRVFTVNQQYLAEYKNTFADKHNIDVLAGYEQYVLKSQVLYGQNDHLFNPLVGELSNADGEPESKIVKSYTNTYMTKGFLARAQYDFDGKYFVSGSYRRDASSRFAPGKQWGNFWSAGGAWLISKEDFMANANWVDMLKLKVSYGQQGNDNLGSYYPYSDQYTHSYSKANGYAISLSYKGNPDLTWEKKNSFNVGFDFEFFNGYLNGTLEYFDQKTSDLLYSKSVPLSAGNPTGSYPVNVGDIRNNGFEFAFDGKIISTKKVNWTWNANFSHYKNTILSLDPSVSENGIKGSNYIYEIGGSLYDAYMYKYAGVNVENGEALYWKHDGETNTDVVTPVFDEATQYKLGSVLPKLYGGLGTSLTAYGIDFSFQLSYQLGGKYYDGTYQALMHTQAAAGQAWHKDALKAWTPENTNTDVPRLDGDTQVSQSAVDRFLISSNYLSINNVTLGYTFPAKWTKAIKLNTIRIYAAGENLAVFSARQGVDPRYSIGLGSYTSGSGLNSGAYSAMRTITGGLTITF